MADGIPWPLFCGGSNVSQSPIADNQDLYNWYSQPRDVTGGRKAERVLYPTPGVEVRASAIPTPGRGVYYKNGRGFAVIGNTLFEVTETGDGTFTLTSRGTVAVNGSPATFAGGDDGSHQIVFTSGDVLYCFDLNTNTLTTERASGNTMCGWLDGYFVVLDAETSTLYVSDLNDGTTWDPTQFAQRSSAPDRWVSMIVRESAREIWLIGEASTDVWNNAGTFPFPFGPIADVLLPFGTIAPFSPYDLDGTLFWLTGTSHGVGQVVAASGVNLQTVTSFAVSWALHEYPTLADAIGDGYSSAGHGFYLLTLPAADVTWAYNLVTREWAKRGTWRSDLNRYQAWRPRFHTQMFGKHVALDSETGDVYEVSESYGYDVDALPIRRLRRPPGLWNNQVMMSIAGVEVLLETGVGLSTGRGSVPVMTMRTSRNGGKTWGIERTREIGRIGEYSQRVRWWQCGSGRSFDAEFVVTDPVPFRVVGALVTPAE